ncbi:MAG: glutathione transferase GstA [Pseudomonas sp.]
MKLYYSPGACSMAVHIVLNEGEFTFDLEQVDLATKKTASGGDFTAVNPNGYVPALELDTGETLTEAIVILGYLADQVPERNLAPAAGSMAHYRLQETLNFLSTELHKGFGSLFKPAMPDDWRQQVKAGLGKRLDVIARQLEGRQYLMGDEFSIADAYLFTILGWSGPVKMDLSPWPVLASYSARIAGRPAVQATMKAEGLIG